MDAVLYADDDEDDDADFRFTVMVKEAEIGAELAERIFGASHPLAKDAQKVLGRGHLQGNYQSPSWQCLSKLITVCSESESPTARAHIRVIAFTRSQAILSGYSSNFQELG